jgi:lysophospholipase L1-like esterase
VQGCAIGGRSSRTFLTEGRWDAVLANLKPGDFVLMQFGHNDGARVGDPAGKQRGSLPGTGPERQAETLPDGTVESVQSFGAYLTRYLREALAHYPCAHVYGFLPSLLVSRARDTLALY